MSEARRLPPTLSVTVTPSQSAFFAGELFTAQITFTNSALPAPAFDYGNYYPSRVNPEPDTVTSGGRRSSLVRRDRPQSSSTNLAEYASNRLDRGDQPISMYRVAESVGSISGSRRSSSSGPSASVEDLTFSRRQYETSETGGALPNPDSRAVTRDGTQSSVQLPTAIPRSSFPPRKGLIGKPLAPSRPSAASRDALLDNNRDLRGAAHSRSKSNAVSNPDFANNRTSIYSSSSQQSSPSTPDSFYSTDNLARDRRRPEPIQLPTSSPSIRRHASTTSLADSDYESFDNSSTSIAYQEESFYGEGHNEAMDELTRAGLEERARHASNWQEGSRSAGAGTTEFHRRTASIAGTSRGRSASSTTFPSSLGNISFRHPQNSLILLWSFVHLEGTFEVDESLIKASEFNEVKRSLLAGFGSGIGGGTLEQTNQVPGWRNWLLGKETERTTAGASLEERKNLMMKDRSVPTFSSPPSILGIDIVLEPGESKTYTFSIPVPADLPPSYRGRAIKFSYRLVLGTNQSPLSHLVDPTSLISRNSSTRLMKVPVRVYNHVGVTGARPFYDLTNPIVYHRDEATILGDDMKIAIRARRPSTGREDFETYACSLLDSVTDRPPFLPASIGTAARPPSPILRMREKTINMESIPSLRPEMRERTRTGSVVTIMDLVETGREEEEEIVGCKAAVEIVSRNSKKVSYDIKKDGYMVASLTLVKSSYRLGESVNGSVVMNSGDGRVLRVSARLETHELVETSIATKSAPQLRELTRRLHAEHHEMTLDSARIGFALSIPSGATPDFATSGVKLQWSVRLSFLVIPPSPDAPLPDPHFRGMRSNGGMPFAPTPISPASSPSKHVRSKSFAYGFEPAVPLTLPAAPTVLPTGATHLMPVISTDIDPNPFFTSYRAVPDLGFVPVLFSSKSSEIELPPSPGPLQRSVRAGAHRSTPSLYSMGAVPKPSQPSVVLVPAKIETVECSIPIKVYPGNTAFRPSVVLFSA